MVQYQYDVTLQQAGVMLLESTPFFITKVKHVARNAPYNSLFNVKLDLHVSAVSKIPSCMLEKREIRETSLK